MWVKKLFACGAVGILLAGSLVAPVSAHGHHRQAEVTDKICSLCTVEDCTETGYHIHDSQVYCGYDHACGYCDGSCGVIEVCTVKGCTETGRHTHDGQNYCGYDHTNGYCDGSCVKQSGSESSSQSGHHSGNHGRHHSKHHG